LIRYENKSLIILASLETISTLKKLKRLQTSLNLKKSLMESEFKRLEALFEYKVLDTLPEKAFDDVVSLASLITECKVALVSLLDNDRQWFKAKIGIDACETDRSISFCTHAIQSDDVMEVQDATKDPRFANNPLVTGPPDIRFYAGAPLINPEGHRLGTLCVIDSHAKKLTPSQIKQLKALARMVVSSLELRKANHKLENYQELLSETSKMSALGEMAAGLAHEINNPLAIISGKVAVAQKKLKGLQIESKILDDLEKAQESVQRISKISKGLRTYARDEVRDPAQSFKLSECVESTLLFCQEKLGQSGIDLKVELDESIFVKGHPGEYSQVLLNLIHNSCYAIKEHESPWISIYLQLEQPDLIHFKVKDSGHGIPKDVQEKMGNPFFTTKPPGEGTGLGLGISKKIMRANGGRLYYNVNSLNTEFIMELSCNTKTI
jgi:C4-dicarboxylate-specific signal transduction histidine kinase